MAINFNLATIGFLLLFAGLMLALAGSSYVTGGSTGVPYNIVYPTEGVGLLLAVIGLIMIIFRAR
jgi:hypothetical protein